MNISNIWEKRERRKLFYFSFLFFLIWKFFFLLGNSFFLFDWKFIMITVQKAGGACGNVVCIICPPLPHFMFKWILLWHFKPLPNVQLLWHFMVYFELHCKKPQKLNKQKILSKYTRFLLVVPKRWTRYISVKFR